MALRSSSRSAEAVASVSPCCSSFCSAATVAAKYAVGLGTILF